MNRIIILSLPFLLAACSNSNVQVANANSTETTSNSNGYRCETVKSTGSNIPKRVCSNASERQAAEELAKKDLRSKVSTNTRRGN